jgi:hypothetical protein
VKRQKVVSRDWRIGDNWEFAGFASLKDCLGDRLGFDDIQTGLPERVIVTAGYISGKAGDRSGARADIYDYQSTAHDLFDGNISQLDVANPEYGPVCCDEFLAGEIDGRSDQADVFHVA